MCLFKSNLTHLEVELNNRSSYNGLLNANAVWQLHLDYFYKKILGYLLII